MTEKRITVKVAEKKHRLIRMKAADLGITISDVVRELLDRWIAGELKTEAESGE